MGWLFDNFQILLVIGIALAAWLKNRGEAKEEEEAERQAREEMIRHLQEVEERPVQKAQTPAQRKSPPPVPQRWDTGPRPPATPEVKPPPLREIFKEVVEQLEPTPGRFQQPQTSTGNAYDEEPAPWDFEHQDASHSEITDTHERQNAVLDRQRKMQERLAELKAQAAEHKGQVAGARETQRRASNQSRGSIADLPPIAEVLKDRSQTRRAIILNEVLGKPIGLRDMA